MAHKVKFDKIVTHRFGVYNPSSYQTDIRSLVTKERTFMETVKIRKSLLIKKLQENKVKHDKLLKQSTENFFKLSEKLLKEATRRFEKKDMMWQTPLSKLVPVIDHSSDFIDILGMLALSTDNIIELTKEEYHAYVLNQWHWRGSFLTNMCYYSGVTGPTGPCGDVGVDGAEGESGSLKEQKIDF